MKYLCWKGKPFKALSFGKGSKKAGRNFSGSITVFHRGGGSKKLLRRIDFQRCISARGLIERIEYDPNRTARIALVRWSNIKLNRFINNSPSGINFEPSTRRGKTLYRSSTRRGFARKGPSVQIRENSPVEDSFKKSSQWNEGVQRNNDETYHYSHTAPNSVDVLGVTGLQPIEALVGQIASTEGVVSARSAYSYILACNNLKPGAEILNINSPHCAPLIQENNYGFSMEQSFQKQGNCLPLWLIPLGSIIHNVELYPGLGGKFARAAGTSAQLVQKNFSTESFSNDSLSHTSSTSSTIDFSQFRSKKNSEHKTPFCSIQLPSGQQLLLDPKCRVTLGVVSNIDHGALKKTKAGQNRWRGFRPVVRGVAMNPIDHPHGGGEGRTKGGRPSVSPWGKPTKGAKRKKCRVSGK